MFFYTDYMSELLFVSLLYTVCMLCVWLGWWDSVFEKCNLEWQFSVWKLIGWINVLLVVC
jgi:hypothetical protein